MSTFRVYFEGRPVGAIGVSSMIGSIVVEAETWRVAALRAMEDPQWREWHETYDHVHVAGVAGKEPHNRFGF